MKLAKLLVVVIALCMFYSAFAKESVATISASGNVQLQAKLDDKGRFTYSVWYKGKVVMEPSALGMVLTTPAVTLSNFKILSVDSLQKDETWQPVLGEVKNIRNQYKELRFLLEDQYGSGIQMQIIFRVFDDGVGFRSAFPEQEKLTHFIVGDELTAFVLTGDHKVFWIPGDYDSNEYPYTTSKLSEIDAEAVMKKYTDIAVRVVPDKYAVQTPLMLKTAEGLYINIHEAALVNYAALQLHVNKANDELTASLVPDALGNKAYLHAPCTTPWRTIIVSDKAADILSSKMILNLNEPSKIQNTSWIKPTKFVGVWWEMQTGKSTWTYADKWADDGKLIPNGKHGANSANVKKYIDFASKNGIKGVLVEGWNVGWEDWFGTWKEGVFDFVTPYPDFDIKEINRYAKEKDVEMIMHNETSGSATNYDYWMDTAFKVMNQYGYHSVKTGYVGKIIPRGEHHDGQWMVNHYVRAASKAAAHEVMIDMHESVRPTGLQRTWPNWLANEAARGNEFNAFSVGSPPEHETILPFTRLMGGPMDYTPGIFKLKGYSASNPKLQLHSTLAKQLALYVTMYSPLQMAADLPENYEAHMDAFQFIKEVAVDWDDTKILEAEPGDYITIARKAKQSNNWFIGGITDENARKANVQLSFLDAGKKYAAIIYRDADTANWETNPEAYTIEKKTVDSKTILDIKLAAGGGFAISIIPL